VTVAERASEVRGVERSSSARAAALRRLAERGITLVVGGALLFAVVWPLLLTDNTFGGDWLAHFWMVWHQAEWLTAEHRPTLFTYATGSAFYPSYAFYGGTLYTGAGLLSVALGGVVRTGFVASWLLAFAMAYGGWVWLGRLLGLGRWAAQVPAILFVSSPYLMTTIYVRGDWPEYMAVSAIPLVAASAVSVLRSDRLRPLPMLALAVSTILLSGSHNITLVWGTVFLVALATGLYVCVPAVRRAIGWRAVARLAAVVVPALLVNAWFLIPDLVYGTKTQIGQDYGQVREALRRSVSVQTWHGIWNLRRVDADPKTTGSALTLPVLAMGWVLVAGALVARRAWGTTWLRVLGLLLLTTTVLTVAMMRPGVLLALPKPFVMIQFSYRLESYILLAVSGGVLAALVLLAKARGLARWWPLLLVPVLASSVYGAVGQADRYEPVADFNSYDAPIFDSIGIFGDATQPELQDQPRPTVVFAARRIHRDRITVTARVGPGALVNTNLLTMAALIHVDGAKVVGAVTTPQYNAAAQRRLVLQVDRDARPGAAKITVSAAHPPAVAIGRALSLLGLCGLLAGFVAALRWSWRARAARAAVRPC
jgi:hypothetical protein